MRLVEYKKLVESYSIIESIQKVYRAVDEVGWGLYDKVHGSCPIGVRTLIGEYNAKTAEETPRIKVTLATSVPRERCERINLGYLDPSSINFVEWKNRENEGILMVPRAGEQLYRLKD